MLGESTVSSEAAVTLSLNILSQIWTSLSVSSRTKVSFDKTRIILRAEAICEAAAEEGNSTGNARSDTSYNNTY